MLPSWLTFQGWIALKSPTTCCVFLKKSTSAFQSLATSTTVGWTVPVSSVQRDCRIGSFPSQVPGLEDLACASRAMGSSSCASFQVWPPSVETSTRLTAPAPDHARPVISWKPGPGILYPPAGRVITDFGPNSNSNQRDFPSSLMLGYRLVSIMAM